MLRKSVETPSTSKLELKKEPVAVQPPKTEVKGEAERTDDGDTSNELVVQKVSVPFTFRGATEFKDYHRIFVRPDESRDEIDAVWDDHEPKDEAALKRLFATYGKGSGTTISVRMNVDDAGKEEFFLDVRHPKPKDDDEDAKHPSVLIDANDTTTIDNIVLDLFHEMSGEDPPDDFASREVLEELVDELKGDVEELEPIEELLREFDMPGDLPANLYDLPTRLRSIFRTAKGMSR